MIYDVIIIWAWAAGLFAWINLPKNFKKLILEKNKSPWIKVLLSGWERANVSNIDIVPERDYFSQNKKFLLWVFAKYNNWDIQSFFAENWVEIIEEDRGRLILKSWDSKELLDLLVKKAKQNNCEIRCNSDVKKIWQTLEEAPTKNVGVNPCVHPENIFKIETEDWKKYLSKNVIVSTGGKSFFQVGTTWEWYNFAKQFWLKIVSPTRALVWLVTKKDFKELSGSSLNCELILKDNKKEIYSEFWPLLFTHFWISWPIVFNTWNALWEYLNSLKIEAEQEKIKYILENIKIELKINPLNSTKKINKFFEEEIKNEEKIEFWLQDWRSWKEAKATWWWIDLNELDKNFRAKKVPWLYFIGEVVDVVGKTWWFNLQWAFSSGYVCGKNL